MVSRQRKQIKIGFEGQLSQVQNLEDDFVVFFLRGSKSQH